VFEMIDHNHDGKISREEGHKYAFGAFDRNHDGKVTRQEFEDGRRRS